MNKRLSPDLLTHFTPKERGSSSLKTVVFPDKSFYQRKSEWKQIIDTTWGPGAPLEEKLMIFNTFTKNVNDKYSYFNSLHLDWDSLKNHYLNQITDSTSKGAFAAIMSHFAYELKRTGARDTTVLYRALKPGVPVLIIGADYKVEHFGAVTTVLPDSTILILRVAPHHPLNIKPGDIILGYEGVPWNNLVRELFNAGLPMIASTSEIKSSEAYQRLVGAGLNWHLFNTIDILQYSTGDTLHLSLESMANYRTPRMMNNEQISIPGIPMPISVPYPEPSDTLVTFGILGNTNIGYIYLSGYQLAETAEYQLFKAIDSLKNTDALIIDMRIGTGGWTFFDKAFNILFNEYHKTITDSYRCNPNTFELCIGGDYNALRILGKDPDYYDRPIAVLLGPSCYAMGDGTAYRLRFHPMIRFFGISTSGGMSHALKITNFHDWELNYAITQTVYVNDPENYLNCEEFPIDFPVWFNKDDVAKGIDPIVEKAKEWINNLAYAHSIIVNKSSFAAEKDTLKAKAIIENPESHELLVKLIIESIDSTKTDSAEMKPLNTGKEWQAIYDADELPENYYWLSVKVDDKTLGTYFTNKHMTRFTTVPLIIDSLVVKKMADYKYSIQPYFKNQGNSVVIQQPISITLSTNPWVKTISPKMAYNPILEPGKAKKAEAFILTCDTTSFQSHFDLQYSLTSQGWPYWVIDTTVAVIPTSSEQLLLPLTTSLNQNYPNPFNFQTTISWQMAKDDRVTFSVFNILGSKVATLLDEYRPAGKYETTINAATLPKGIYFYQLKAGKFNQTMKMIVVK